MPKSKDALEQASDTQHMQTKLPRLLGVGASNNPGTPFLKVMDEKVAHDSLAEDPTSGYRLDLISVADAVQFFWEGGQSAKEPSSGLEVLVDDQPIPFGPVEAHETDDGTRKYSRAAAELPEGHGNSTVEIKDAQGRTVARYEASRPTPLMRAGRRAEENREEAPIQDLYVGIAAGVVKSLGFGDAIDPIKLRAAQKTREEAAASRENSGEMEVADEIPKAPSSLQKLLANRDTHETFAGLGRRRYGADGQVRESRSGAAKRTAERARRHGKQLGFDLTLMDFLVGTKIEGNVKSALRGAAIGLGKDLVEMLPQASAWMLYRSASAYHSAMFEKD